MKTKTHKRLQGGGGGWGGGMAHWYAVSTHVRIAMAWNGLRVSHCPGTLHGRKKP
jgi:hypothetical protein